MADFESFINRTDIEVLQVDVKVVEQSFMFQESFAAVVFYKEVVKFIENKSARNDTNND